MPIERIQPEGLAKPPTYSHVVRAGNTIYVAGQTAQNERGELVGKGDVTAQAEQVYQNIGKALASVGAGFQHVVKATVFITDARFREPVSEVRARYLAGNLPASTLLVVAGLASPDMLLEVEVIASLD